MLGLGFLCGVQDGFTTGNPKPETMNVPAKHQKVGKAPRVDPTPRSQDFRVLSLGFKVLGLGFSV